MVAVGMALIWAGYAVGLWGYCLLNTYDITFTQLFSSAWPSASSGATQSQAQQGGGTRTELPQA